MAEPLTVRDMDDIEFQRKEWIVERVGWVALLAFLVAAATGIFGIGPVSETSAEADDGTMEVHYERFLRNVGTATMTVSIRPSAVEAGKARLYISRDLLAGWRMQNVSPAPSTESSSEQWLIYEFDVLGDTPPQVEFLYRGDGFGPHGGAVRAGDGAPVHVSQFIYP